MKENKHIEKELLFKNNIKDITSISLDSEYKIENNNIVGNFLINGEYKIHEVSINREKFNFKIPFKHEIENDIDRNTTKLEITNFIYDYKKDELIVNIDYIIEGDRKSILEFDDEETLDEFLNKREVEVIDTRINDIKEEVNKEKNNVENFDRKSIDKIEEKELKDNIINKELELEETKEDINTNNNEELNKNIKLEDNLDREKIETEKIMNKIDKTTDGFVTYKICKLKENETLENIVIKYHTTIDELKEYNDLNNLNIGDKIIIPKYE